MLTISEAALRLGVSEGTVRRLVNKQRLRHVRIGCGRGVIRIPEDALDDYLGGATVGPRPDKPRPRPMLRVALRHLRL